MTTNTTTTTATSALDFVISSFLQLEEQKCANYVSDILQALKRKAIKAASAAEFDSSVKVHLHCIDYATDLLADSQSCKFAHAAKIDASLCSFIDRMSNIKAIDYAFRYLRALSHDNASALNNYMSSTLRALIDCERSVSYNDIRAALSVSLSKSDARITQMHYSSSTASAQSSMTINALEALDIIERTSKRSSDATITVKTDEQSEILFSALVSLLKRFNFSR